MYRRQLPEEKLTPGTALANAHTYTDHNITLHMSRNITKN